jgi:hypothetical protein
LRNSTGAKDGPNYKETNMERFWVALWILAVAAGDSIVDIVCRNFLGG